MALSQSVARSEVSVWLTEPTKPQIFERLPWSTSIAFPNRVGARFAMNVEDDAPPDENTAT
jgi:hypothetical protein